MQAALPWPLGGVPQGAAAMATALEVDDYRRVFPSSNVRNHAIGEFKNRVIEALHREFGLRNSTLLHRSLLWGALRIPTPCSTAGPWHSSTSTARTGSTRRVPTRRGPGQAGAVRVLSAHDLTVLPEASRMYLRDFLGRRGVADVGTLYLRATATATASLACSLSTPRSPSATCRCWGHRGNS